MSALPQLDISNAVWDKFREAVVIPAGCDQVVVSLDALESWANRDLTHDEAVDLAVDEKALLATVANTLASHDNVITITRGILNSRSWTVEPYDDGPEDSGPIYVQAAGDIR